MRKRTRARQLALEVLFQVDLLGASSLTEAMEDMAGRSDDATVTAFAVALVRGTLDKVADIDRVIREVAENWDLARMATVDRNVLRLGAFELLYREDIPPKVSINEAIDLAKSYSTAESGTFVNGILDRIKNAYAPKEKGAVLADALAAADQAPQAAGDLSAEASAEEEAAEGGEEE